MLTVDETVKKCYIGGNNPSPLCTFCFNTGCTHAFSGGHHPNYQQEKIGRRRKIEITLMKSCNRATGRVVSLRLIMYILCKIITLVLMYQH